MASRSRVGITGASRLARALALIVTGVAAQAQETIVLDGSTGMIPLARALVAAYQKQSEGPAIQVGKGLGTGARLRALAEAKIQIALASHGIDPEVVRKNRLRVIEIAKGAIVFAVNQTVPLSNLTDTQMCDIYGGRITTWRQLGGPDSPIAVHTRPPTEVDPEVILEKVACFRDLKAAEAVRVMPRGGDMAHALAETAHAIGMTSMTVVEQGSGKVRALSFNGIAPTPENVKSGRYFLSRGFYLVVPESPAPEVRKFIDFVLSPAGDQVITANGAIPVR